MRFFKTKTNIIFCAVILLLSADLIATSVVIVQKNNKIEEIKSLIEKNETEIGEISGREAELEAKLRDSEKNAAAISAELETAKQEKEKLSAEKKKLEEENKSLKKKIEKLSAEKKAQEEAANLAASKPSSGGETSPVPNDGSKICYLTFDDGPSTNTLKILDTLNRYNAKATFFVTKNANIAYVKKAYSAGHTVGLHTASHVYSQIYKSTDAYYSDLSAISAAVEQQIGIKSNIIRFPGGSSNAISKQYCKGIMTSLTKSVVDKGYFYFDWNVDSGDAGSAKGNSAAIATNVINSAKNKKLICVLMHDTSAATAKALPAIIEGLSAQGYSFKALTAESYHFHHGKLSN